MIYSINDRVLINHDGVIYSKGIITYIEHYEGPYYYTVYHVSWTDHNRSVHSGIFLNQSIKLDEQYYRDIKLQSIGIGMIK